MKLPVATPSQRKGDGFERDVTRFLREHGIPVVRQHKGGTLDTGDLVFGPFLVEAKAYSDYTKGIREGLDQAERSTMRFPGFIPAAVVRRVGFGIGGSFFVMRIRELPRLWDHLKEP